MANKWVVAGHTDVEAQRKAIAFTGKLWEQTQQADSKLTDVRIHLDCGSVFHAHRSVLSARSNVFLGMFESDMEEARTGEVKISEVSRSAFGEFLSFIYTLSTSKAADGAELWSLADVYEVEELKEFLLSSLNEDSVLGAVRFASNTGCPMAREALHTACAEVGRKCLASITKERLVGVSVGECELLLSHCSGGLDKFKFVERWYTANRESGSAEGQLEEDAGGGVEQLLDMADLRMVSTADLLAVVKPSKIVSPEGLNTLYERRLRSMEWAAQKFEHLKSIGTLGRGDRELNRPVGVAITEDDKIVVADQENCRIQIVGLNSTSHLRFGSRGDGFGRFLNPVSVTSDHQGMLYVCDHDRHEIQVFRVDGTFVRVFGGEGSDRGRLMNPRDSALTTEGNVVVCDKGNHRMQVFKPDGTFVFSFGSMGEFEGLFKDPCGVAVGPEGDMVVADSGNARVQVFDRDGGFIKSFGSRGDGPGQFQSPDGIAVSALGDILVSDWRSNSVSIFRGDGTFVQAFGSVGDGEGQFKGPAGLAVSTQGSVVVADQLHHRVQVWGRL